jgi:hypothetical protein
MVEHISIVERLIRLKAYLATLSKESEPHINVNDDQWPIAANLKVFCNLL